MNTRRAFLTRLAVLSAARPIAFGASGAAELDPRGRIHIPIGIADTLDTLKTFVEAEGSFSPGFGSYGVYFWVFDREADRMIAPTMPGVSSEHGLQSPGYLIPWSRWDAGGVEVTSEVCEVAKRTPQGQGMVVGARARLRNPGAAARRVSLLVALRPLGPAGWAVKRLDVSPDGAALLVDGRAAIVPETKPTAAGVSPTDDAGAFSLEGKVPAADSAVSAAGDCSGVLQFDIALPAGGERTFGFVCPVLPGRRAARHKWTDMKQNAMVDAAELNPDQGGIKQPDPGLAYYRSLRAGALFEEATAYWKSISGKIAVRLPDPRWGECMSAILGHAAVCMNEGAPDVAAINYNVFNRDGMYVANILQKCGLFGLSGRALDYFLHHPFNGRAYPEADNPGQILWSLSQQWLFARDREWLLSVYPSVRKIARMIAYYRGTPGPHWVSFSSLDFGEAVPAAERQELKPGSCDGHHPEYTEAFDVAGLRGAVGLAEARGDREDAGRWRTLAESLMRRYDETYGANLRAKEYGNYSVLWPCGLYPVDAGRGREQFSAVGAQKPGGWRYFPLATAHQGLLAGNREAGYATLQAHLEHPYMKGWYALDEFDEGPGSGGGSWHKVRSTWPVNREKPGDNASVAMPHGWAVAEVWLLMRDALVFEAGESLVLLGGIPPEWFRAPQGMQVSGLRTPFGPLELEYRVSGSQAVLNLSGGAAPPKGFRLRIPATVKVLG